MENAYGLDADYFIRLFARELNPDVVRNQTPTCLARVLLRAARTASEQVFAELEFSDLFPKPAEALAGITLSAEGEANTYRMMRGGNWLASIRMNGELPVSQQEAILSAMLASPPADHSAHGLNMVGALATALDGLLSITQDSAGVAGYHLNGNVAEWDEFPEVGTARDVLNLCRERSAKPPAAAAQGQGEMQSAAVRDVLAERNRQITAEGWTPEHDDEHDDGQIADAAACYALTAAGWSTYAARERWPWSLEWWKPSTPRRDLIKAGALVLAEIERLDRAALAASTGQEV
ncbi:hypothetical protein [Aquipseudomonas alcaligenes]|uniref:hypothetical protein n=1 Tax=Aquipseudomonas alcaligenes TaxID=43263 RepID=UPI0036695B4A